MPELHATNTDVLHMDVPNVQPKIQMTPPIQRRLRQIEQSLQQATEWAVFEQNGEPLWAELRRTVSNLLVGLFREGTLHGASPTQAFFVTCDRTTMTQNDIDNGIVRILVGLALMKPAEFVTFSLTQATQ